MDTLSYLIGKKSGSGPSGTIIDSLSITDNGHYVAPAGHAYNPVHVEMLKPSGNILLTNNGLNIDVAQYATATVNVQGGSVISLPKKDVNFFDYDGTVVAAYTAAEFIDLFILPENPTHNGLIAQGWNWTLANAKTYVATYGMLNIGQMYTTVDGKTRLYITIPSNAPSYARTLELQFGITSGSVTVDYGDGNDPVTITSSSVSLSHDYTDTGDYVITLTVNSGTVQFNTKIFNDSTANTNRRTWLTHIEIGSGVTSIGNTAFYNCCALQSVTISSSVTSIESYAFGYCYTLRSVTIPSSVTNIWTCAFYNCNSLQSVMIPNNVTNIWNSAFHNCNSLQSVTIPNNVINIKGSTFTSCYALQSVMIPSNVTNIETSVFNDCYSLQSVTIPSNVTNIGALVFNNCYALYAIHFKTTTPPIVDNSNTWNNLPTSCKIFIPFSASINYLTATNYPSSSTYTYVGYATYVDGATLPTQDSSQRCNVRWYPTITDAINQTNQITVGNGNEIYCRYV